MGYSNPRFPPFSGWLWMLLDEEKRTNGAGDDIKLELEAFEIKRNYAA